MAEAVLPRRAQRVKEAGWLLSLEDLVRDERLADRKSVGGKAARLVWLKKNGFLVPETWVLPQKAFAAALRELPPACEPRSLLRAATGRSAYARAAEARQEFLEAKLPARLEELQRMCSAASAAVTHRFFTEQAPQVWVPEEAG